MGDRLIMWGAADGYILEPRDADLLDRAFSGFPQHAKEIFGKDGRALRRGERLHQKDLARSLRLIADGGAAVFYKGEIARAIDAEMKQAQGFLALADLSADRAEWWKPITIRYRGVDVVTASAPANAFDYLVRLGIMSRFDNAALGHNSVEYLHRFAEATKHGFWVRLRHAGDPDVAPPPVGRLLSEAYWREQANAIHPSKAKPFIPPGVSAVVQPFRADSTPAGVSAVVQPFRADSTPPGVSSVVQPFRADSTVAAYSPEGLDYERSYEHRRP